MKFNIGSESQSQFQHNYNAFPFHECFLKYLSRTKSSWSTKVELWTEIFGVLKDIRRVIFWSLFLSSVVRWDVQAWLHFSNLSPQLAKFMRNVSGNEVSLQVRCIVCVMHCSSAAAKLFGGHVCVYGRNSTSFSETIQCLEKKTRQAALCSKRWWRGENRICQAPISWQDLAKGIRLLRGIKFLIANEHWKVNRTFLVQAICGLSECESLLILISLYWCGTSSRHRLLVELAEHLNLLLFHCSRVLSAVSALENCWKKAKRTWWRRGQGQEENLVSVVPSRMAANRHDSFVVTTLWNTGARVPIVQKASIHHLKRNDCWTSWTGLFPRGCWSKPTRPILAW